jgi:SAM-dependent methyltransferase
VIKHILESAGCLSSMPPTATPKDPTERFSSGVKLYVKYRPKYPRAILDILNAEGALSPTAAVADVGSGTGILTELFLRNSNPVFGVEPNREMREAGEALLKDYSKFTSIEGAALVVFLHP